MKFRYATLLAFVPALAQAHPGHGLQSGLEAGLLHPLSGLDHLLAMLTVGAWAAFLGGRARWAVPTAFVAALLVGSLVPAALPSGVVEQAIAASLLLIGALLALAVRLPLAASLTLVAAFAVFHGLAHGSEAPLDGGIGYRAGFVVSTALLHAIGFAIAAAVLHRPALPLLRLAGTGVGLAGAALLATTF
ncbi:MAG: HupE/UreJ family protein [Steroidobacteraceae bacterium]